VTVDILERASRGFRLIEVKSTTSVKKHHVPDVAVQAHVLRQNGLDLVSSEVMHLNRESAYPDLSNLFIRADVTEAVKAVEAEVPDLLDEQIAMLQGPIPAVPIRPHCTTPYECPFMTRCWATLPPHPVSTLYAMRRRALALDEQGYRTIYDLPEDVSLGLVADRQRRAVQENRLSSSSRTLPERSMSLSRRLRFSISRPLALRSRSGMAAILTTQCRSSSAATYKRQMGVSLTTSGSPMGPKTRG
jgi:hypothetical protein